MVKAGPRTLCCRGVGCRQLCRRSWATPPHCCDPPNVTPCLWDAAAPAPSSASPAAARSGRAVPVGHAWDGAGVAGEIKHKLPVLFFCFFPTPAGAGAGDSPSPPPAMLAASSRFVLWKSPDFPRSRPSPSALPRTAGASPAPPPRRPWPAGMSLLEATATAPAPARLRDSRDVVRGLCVRGSRHPPFLAEDFAPARQARHSFSTGSSSGSAACPPSRAPTGTRRVDGERGLAEAGGKAAVLAGRSLSRRSPPEVHGAKLCGQKEVLAGVGGGWQARVLHAQAPRWQLTCAVCHQGEVAEGMGAQAGTLPPGATSQQRPAQTRAGGTKAECGRRLRGSPVS